MKRPGFLFITLHKVPSVISLVPMHLPDLDDRELIHGFLELCFSTLMSSLWASPTEKGQTQTHYSI